MNNKLSKVFALLLAMLILVSQTLVPIAAEPEEEQETQGELLQCTCAAELRGEPGEPGAENEKWITFVEATCTDYAYDEFYCDNCGGWYPVIQYDDEGYLPLYHEGIEDIEFTEEAEASCFTDGALATFRACPICGNCFNEDGEVFTIVVEDEETTIVAMDEDDCNQFTVFATEGDLIVPAYGEHDWDEGVVTVATCVAQGYTTYTCQRCGEQWIDPDSYTDIDPENHAEPEQDTDPASQPLICGEQDAVEFWHCNACEAEYQIVIEAYEPDHVEHEYTIIPQVDEADCFTPVTWLYHCTYCGFEEIVENVADALGHNYTAEDWVEAVEPTCTEDGVVGHYYCDRCGYYFDADGNIFVMVEVGQEQEPQLDVIDPEERDADTVYATEDDLVIPALGHDWDDGVVTAPDCSHTGYTTYTCQREGCDETYVGDETPIDPNKHHEYNSIERILPTCGQQGWTEEVRCDYCNKLLASPKPIDALDHEPLDAVEENRVNANCTVDGSYDMVVYCANCGGELERNSYVIVAPGHEPDDAVEENVVLPTCTEDGSYDSVVYCGVCGEELEREPVVDPATGHSFDLDTDWVDTVRPTCTKEDEFTDGAVGHYYCEYCEKYFDEDGETEISEEDIIIPGGHEWQYSGVRIDPTCLEQGYKIHQCARCEKVERYDFVDALGHDYEAVVTEPTCLEGGYTTYTCKRENPDYSAEDPDDVIVCGDTYVDDYTDALGHNYVGVVTEPTCLEGGYTTYTCTRCQDTYDDDFTDALGHNYEDVVTNPTCLEGGYTTHTCSRCQDTYTDTETEALGHNYEDVVTEPTCLEGGYTTYTCTRCGDSYIDDETEALGHDPKSEKVDDGNGNVYEVIVCDRCHEELFSGIQDELIQFNYEATGINGGEYAVNSGVIYLNVYLDVISTYARLYGVDFALDFDEHLTLVDVNFERDLNANGCIFAVAENTDLALANELHKVILTQNMGFAGETEKVFTEGRYLFATLMFKVDKDFYAADVSFSYVDGTGTAARDADLEYANVLNVDFNGDAAWINVKMLGDANGDHNINTIDSLAFTKYFLALDDDDYEGIFDMNKDGFIDGDDFDLMLNAVAGNNFYLDICVILDGDN